MKLKKNKIKYKHKTDIHNMLAPRELVPIIMQFGNFNSVVDVGCGLGTFLRAFKENGVEKILGIDGPWCKKELLFQNISEEEFLEFDLERDFNLNYKFDLAISLEVAEHLSPSRASSFVENLCNLSDTVLFSAAVPYQGGENHLNEQPLSYWINLFNKNNYKCLDVIRPLIWNNNKIFWWYRQNIVLFQKVDEGEILVNNLYHLVDIIHPELLKAYADPSQPFALKRHLKILIHSLLKIK